MCLMYVSVRFYIRVIFVLLISRIPFKSSGIFIISRLSCWTFFWAIPFHKIPHPICYLFSIHLLINFPHCFFICHLFDPFNVLRYPLFPNFKYFVFFFSPFLNELVLYPYKCVLKTTIFTYDLIFLFVYIKYFFITYYFWFLFGFFLYNLLLIFYTVLSFNSFFLQKSTTGFEFYFYYFCFPIIISF